MDVGQCSEPGGDVKGDYGFNETSVECCQNGLVDLEFAEFTKEKETLLALGVDDISICFEVEFVIDCCPKVSVCVNPLSTMDLSKKLHGLLSEIGRASCRERVCQYV